MAYFFRIFIGLRALFTLKILSHRNSYRWLERTQSSPRLVLPHWLRAMTQNLQCEKSSELAQLAQVITRFRTLQIDLKTRLSDELSVNGIQFDLFIRLECLNHFFDFLENCHSVDWVGSVGPSDHKISNITNRS